jgi:hypothetical protein
MSDQSWRTKFDFNLQTNLEMNLVWTEIMHTALACKDQGKIVEEKFLKIDFQAFARGFKAILKWICKL